MSAEVQGHRSQNVGIFKIIRSILRSGWSNEVTKPVGRSYQIPQIWLVLGFHRCFGLKDVLTTASVSCASLQTGTEASSSNWSSSVTGTVSHYRLTTPCPFGVTSVWPPSFFFYVIKEVDALANTNTNIQTSVVAMLPPRQLARKQNMVCITVNQACKIQNLAEVASQRCLLTVPLLYDHTKTVVCFYLPILNFNVPEVVSAEFKFLHVRHAESQNRRLHTWYGMGKVITWCDR